MSRDHDESAGSRDEPPGYVRVGNALLAVTEDVIYVGIATVLAVGALALLVAAGRGMTELGGDVDTGELVLEVLDTLLLVFIVVELLYAVRVILGKREVVAEPFLVVGMIASIKEIIVLSVQAADLIGKNQKFTHAMVEVGVLGALVLVLAVAAILLRAKEREPEEGDESARAPELADATGRRPAQGDPGDA
jgi:uncharacterized membrane protein (DUF373 family)